MRGEAGAAVEAGGTTPVRFRPPEVRRAVSRAPLIDRLRASGAALVTVSASMGAGKTSLLAEWARSDPRQVAWASLDDTDRDPIALVQTVAGALVEVGLIPAVADGPVGPSTGRAHEVLAGQLASSTIPFLLILDDVHRVGPASEDLLDRLARHIPDGSTLVLAGRVDLDLVAARRVDTPVLEVTNADLAFDAGSAAAVFAAAGLELGGDAADRIIERTDGWAAGVYLATLIARDDPRALDRPAPVGGSNRYIADYLLHEAFSRLDADLQDFLLTTAVLDELSAELCDAVRGSTRSAELLRRLERENLFVIPLDDQRQWYRLHALFREFLLSQAHQAPQPDPTEAQRRAARWWIDAGSDDRAIEYLLRCRDLDQLGRALTRAVRPAFLQGRAATIDRWLREAGPEAITAMPPLACLAGWTAATSGRASEAERWAEAIGTLDYDGPTEDGWSSFTSAAAGFRALLCADGVEAMGRDADLAASLEPVWSPWRNTVGWLVGASRELAGDTDGAIAAYDEVLALDAEAGRTPILIAPVARAIIAMDRNDWAAAERGVDRTLELLRARTPGLLLPAALAHAVVARLAQHQGRPDAAAEHLDQAMSWRTAGTYAVPHAAVRLRLLLADTHLAAGDRATAQLLLGEIDLILARRPHLGTLVAATDALRRALSTPAAGGIELTPAEARLLPHLQTHLTFAEIATELFVSRHTVNTQAAAIYRKLGASSRSAAVSRARELRLL